MFEENISKSKGLTVEKLKQYKGLENISDKEAEEMLESIKRYSNILLRAYPFEKLKEEIEKEEKNP